MAYRDGLAQLNQRISGLRSALDAADAARLRQVELEAAGAEIEARAAAAAERTLEAESMEKRLRGNGLRSLLLKLVGKHKARLDGAIAELASARQDTSEIRRELDVHTAKMAETQSAIDEASDAEAMLEALRKEKEAWLAENGGPVADELASRMASIGQIEALGVEIDQAVAAGRQAQQALAAVARSLGSAKGWGTFDMLGGGLIATAVKHSKIDKAKKQLGKAQVAIANFERESKEVQLHLETALEIDNFSTFADYFFDGLFFDWAVQSKISRSKESVEQANRQVVAAIEKLGEHRAELIKRLSAAKRQRVELIERWGA